MKGKRHNRNGMMKRYGDEARHLYARTGDKVNVTDILLNMLVQREQRNELPWLTPQRAVELYEAWRRGEQADVQRVWEQLEETDDTLMTVLDKRQRALERMPWGILADAEAVGDNEELARKSELQQAYLRTVFNAVENLDEALVHLGMADFRGVAALEITGNMQRMRWEVIEPWCLARPVRRGPWMYNAKADSTYTFLEELEREAVIVREARPIDLAAMFLIVDKMHAIHGWDAFLDVFGNPSIFLELPAATSEAMADVYDKLAKRIIGDGRGTIPNGSKFQTVETRQNNCDSFEKRAKWCREAIITVATGGLLTVSTEAGSGTLAGNAHADSFESLVAGTAAAISAVINKQFVRRLLAAAFPDEPALAYFSLAPEPADERLEMAQLLTTLKTAGWQTTAEKASEMMQMELEAAPAPAAGAPGEIQNTKDEIQKPVVGEPVANRGDEAGEEALTDAEMRAFMELGTPNAGRMTARLVEVEAALRKAADIGADAPVNSDESLKADVDAVENAGTSAGAKKGWDKRGRGRRDDWQNAREGMTPKQNATNGIRAMRWAMNNGKDAERVMHRKGLGWVDFPYGRPGTPKPNGKGVTHTDGYGLSHIEAKHGERAVRRMPLILAYGKIKQRPEEGKATVTYGNEEVHLRVSKGKKKSWTTTSYNVTRTNKKDDY